MSREKAVSGGPVYPLGDIAATTPSQRDSMGKMDVFDLRGVQIERLPFAFGDTTAGNETELQAVVAGRKNDVDLPNLIENSNYFSNILRRAASGDLPGKTVTELEKFINDNSENIWENSWVRLPVDTLGAFARKTVAEDMLADKGNPSQGNRTDMHKFLTTCRNRECLRIPVSYLLKIALADSIDVDKPLAPAIFETGAALMSHFLSDNTSPETFSLYVSGHADGAGPGRAMAKETAKRFLLTQLLVMYANRKFGLAGSGQKVMVFFSPHPPYRQKKLNACISDAFYRELFMNPCLTGWNRGETKHEYMHLCHQVLSRSQMNALAKLREAGIIANNLVVLPNTSNISLANNGIHVSLGSRKLTALMKDSASGYTRRHEKYVGDLTVKILEHFIPLFINSYSASPYRLDFTDFHPERALGFLAHELDFTHLRMLWRRWRKKARLNIFGRPVTPFGPPSIDNALRALLGLKGDYVADYRLIDYLVALMSTERSPALNGALFNQDRLREDLHDLGVFDKSMSIYSFIKLRECDVMGFSGFESRYYSLFPSFEDDMARAVDLQNLLHLLAFKYMAEGLVTHEHIPDEPFIESERRQIIFGRAIGIPTFFVKRDTTNMFMKKILGKTRNVRSSSRYPGYLRIKNDEYCRALIDTIRDDGADLIAMMGMEETLDDLSARIAEPENKSAFGKLTGGIVKSLAIASPLRVSGDAFNMGVENYYRATLRKEHLREGWRFFEQDVRMKERASGPEGRSSGRMIRLLSGCQDMDGFMNASYHDLLRENLSEPDIRRLIHLLLYTIQEDALQEERRGHDGLLHAVRAGTFAETARVEPDYACSGVK
jgi:hypothetical protein